MIASKAWRIPIVLLTREIARQLGISNFLPNPCNQDLPAGTDRRCYGAADTGANQGYNGEHVAFNRPMHSAKTRFGTWLHWLASAGFGEGSTKLNNSDSCFVLSNLANRRKLLEMCNEYYVSFQSGARIATSQSMALVDRSCATRWSSF